jgi:hypothetical protein
VPTDGTAQQPPFRAAIECAVHAAEQPADGAAVSTTIHPTILTAYDTALVGPCHAAFDATLNSAQRTANAEPVGAAIGAAIDAAQ